MDNFIKNRTFLSKKNKKMENIKFEEMVIRLWKINQCKVNDSGYLILKNANILFELNTLISYVTSSFPNDIYHFPSKV